MDIKWIMQQNKKERENYQFLKMINRYWAECGECEPRKATPEELEKYKTKEKKKCISV